MLSFSQKLKTWNILLREHQQKTFVPLSRFWPLRGWGVWINPLKKENLRQKSFFRKFWMRFYKVVKNDIGWCKSCCKTTRNKRTGSCILYFLMRSTCKTWNTMYHQACIFHLILLGISSSMALYVTNRGWGGFYLMDKIF